MPSPTHILVFRFSAMGDVAMTVPVLRALTHQYPSLKITVVTKPFFKPIFSDLKNTTVFPADTKNKYKGILGLYQLSKKLNALDFDVVADLHQVLRTRILKIFLKHTPFISVDKGRSEKKKLISGQVFYKLKTTHQRYAEVFKKLGYPIDLSQTIIPEHKQLNKKLRLLYFKQNLPRIGIAPFAAHEGKMYPLTKMKKVIQALSNSSNVVLFGGGKKEIKQLKHIANLYKNTTSVAGQLYFEEELSLISNLDIMISMDSGNGHLAAMLGVKVLTIWGVTHPYAGFAPYNQPEDYSLIPSRKDFPLIPTSIFGNKYPEHYKNVAGSISPETIVHKIESIIKPKTDTVS